MILETLSKEDDDSSKNVGKKMNLRYVKLNRVYLDPLKMSNVGDDSRSWILKDFIQVQKEVGKFVISYVHILHITSNKEVSRRSRAVDIKEMY